MKLQTSLFRVWTNVIFTRVISLVFGENKFFWSAHRQKKCKPLWKIEELGTRDCYKFSPYKNYQWQKMLKSSVLLSVLREGTEGSLTTWSAIYKRNVHLFARFLWDVFLIVFWTGDSRIFSCHCTQYCVFTSKRVQVMWPCPCNPFGCSGKLRQTGKRALGSIVLVICAVLKVPNHPDLDWWEFFEYSKRWGKIFNEYLTVDSKDW